MTKALWTALGVVLVVNGLYIVFGVYWERHRLRNLVFQNLDSAYVNGYFGVGEQLHEATADEIAYDMTLYCADLESERLIHLTPHVRAWLQHRGLV